MIGKLFSRNTFLLALIVLFCSICLLPMNLFADHHSDHDNMYVNNTASQTSLGLSFSDPYVYTGAYANIFNYNNFPVRYYLSASLSVLWKGRREFRYKSDPDKGWVPGNDWKSFFPSIDIDMTGGKRGEYRANGDVSLLLKFDFDGNGTFDDTAEFGSSAYIEFNTEE